MPNKSYLFDLTDSTLTLDYDGLLEVATIAMRYSLKALEERMRPWYDVGFIVPPTTADRLQEDAAALAQATRVYHYLVTGQDRQKVSIERR